MVRGDILLGGDDGLFSPGYSIDAGGETHVPTLRFGDQQLGRVLVTGKGFADHECEKFVYFGMDESGKPILGLIFGGFEHSCSAPCVSLNKDGPAGAMARRVLHAKARDLATLQTAYEWCRLVRAAGLSDRDGLLLTTWVRPSRDPRPAGTPCAPAARPGGSAVEVTVLRVKVRHDGDDDGPGEVALSAALYDSPNPLRRFVQSQTLGFGAKVNDGDWMPAGKLPRPLALCVPRGTGATFALYGWDNDDDGHDVLEQHYDFDDAGDNADDLRTGFQVRFGPKLPYGERVAGTSGDADLEVHYRVDRVAPLRPGGQPQQPLCRDDVVKPTRAGT